MGINETILTAIQGIHTKIDDGNTAAQGQINTIVEKVSEIQVSAAEVRKDVGQVTKNGNSLKETVNTHLEDHEETRRGWVHQIVVVICGVIVVVAAAVILSKIGVN